VECALALVVLLFAAFGFRSVGLNWDEGAHLHPDERHLTMVVGDIKSPDSLALFLDTAHSPLSPYNRGYGNFFYGTLPIFLVRYAGEWADTACAEEPSRLARAVVWLFLNAEGPALSGAEGACTPGTYTGYGGVHLVGRMLSALADLGGLVFLFFIGRRLYGPGVGLLAVALGALAVLPIQQSHFFVVDNFAHFFVVATLYFAVRASQTGGWGAFALAGLASGLAVTCKMSTWPAALVVGLAGVVWWWKGRHLPESSQLSGRYEEGGGRRLSLIPGPWSWMSTSMRLVLRFILAGVVFLVAVRLGQPYAFQGPGFFGVRLNPQWLSDMGFIRRLMSGEVDSPPGHQWTARTPIVFPWVNMVVWGLGLPLGLAAWAGWALVGVELLRGQRRHLIPWAWGTGFFLYQATQWVKSMRYILPVYYVFILFAAYALLRLIRWAITARMSRIDGWGSRFRGIFRYLPLVVGLLSLVVVLAGTLFWAVAFTRIYTRTTTRLAASRWIYANVPAGATLHYQTESGPGTLQIAVPGGYVYGDGAELQTPFTMPEDGLATAVTFNYLGDPQGDAEVEGFRVALRANPGGGESLGGAMGEWAMPSLAMPAEAIVLGETSGRDVSADGYIRRGQAYTFVLNAVPLQGGQTYVLASQCASGCPVQADTSVVANEHWDDPLPLRIEGYNPFGGMYRGLTSSSDGQMQNYNEDTPEKRAQLFAWLDEADYIFLSSNRLYGSIARLPARYPLTTAYYRALFAGQLGFELAADITSYPALGPFQFPDQECPYPLPSLPSPPSPPYLHQREPIRVSFPPAEEAFSVYDHPRVLIFRKTAAYSREQAEQVLGGIDLTRALHGLKPVQATAARNLLEFDPQTWAEQQAGGTWSEMFHRDSLFNRYPALAAVAWWIVVTLLGWLAFPLLFVAVPALRDRGYGLARVLALLAVAYLTWLVASLRVLPNTRGTILRMVLLLALAGGGVGWLKRGDLVRFVRGHRRLILATEGLFALLYLAWIGVRLLQPDLWHPTVGGEKPMDFAYLNAVMKSTWFPPYNPWFSGSWLNYYYFGFVIIGTLIKLMGTVPAIGYNLVVPLLVALTGVGAFSAAYNLFGGHRRGAMLAGAMGLVFTVVLGNLGVVHLIRTALITLGGEPFPSTIPVFAETVAMFRGLWQVIAHGTSLPLRIEAWYWHPTRIIPAWPGEAGPITEFPAFTFLYGDLHAHMIALPLTLLALALAVYWMRSRRPTWLSLALGGLAIGALYPTNTWDYPTYLALGVVGLALGTTQTANRKSQIASRLWGFVGRAAALIGLSVVLYLPYLQHYAAGYTSVEMWRGSRTPADIYLWIHGIVLFPLVTRMVIEIRNAYCVTRKSRIANRKSPTSNFQPPTSNLQLPTSNLQPATSDLQPPTSNLQPPTSNFQLPTSSLQLPFVLLLVGVVVVMVVMVGLGYWVAAVVVPVGMAAAYLLLAPGMLASRRLLWLMAGTSMALCLAVEVIVLKGDISRMNTVFKFYLQVWTLLSVAAAVSLAWVRERALRWTAEWRTLWWIGMGLLILGGALFLPYGIRARAVDRMSPQTGLTLDGMAFARTGTVVDGTPGQEGGVAQEIPLAGDYAAIRWMQDHVPGSPVILEGLGYREYLWANRVSIYTGLPAVVGWRWHQAQQRAALPDSMVDWRRNDVDECYNTPDAARAWEILSRYGVRYVYVGAYERAYYDPAGLAKFEAMVAEGMLRVVYDAEGVKIYQSHLTNPLLTVYM
jgi:YYY domain-containing protein